MSSLIKCKVTDCSYNNAQICSKNGIYVSGESAHMEQDTSCKSFAKGSGSTNAFSNNTFSNNAFYNSAAPHAKIDCAAHNCTYNTNSICSKDEIWVEPSAPSGNCISADQTYCHSFQKR